MMLLAKVMAVAVAMWVTDDSDDKNDDAKAVAIISNILMNSITNFAREETEYNSVSGRGV